MTFKELRDHVNAPESTPARAYFCHDCGTKHRDDAECPYQRHVANEGHSAWNEHPDGCYHCGSTHHHSSDCRTDGEGHWGEDAY